MTKKVDVQECRCASEFQGSNNICIRDIISSRNVVLDSSTNDLCSDQCNLKRDNFYYLSADNIPVYSFRIVEQDRKTNNIII